MSPVFCPVCSHWADHLAPGPAGRPAAACPRCGALERHRVAALLIPYLLGVINSPGSILEAAPQSGLSDVLASIGGDDLVRFDVDHPIGGVIDVRASITELPFRSGSCRFVYCSHVLEHVADDHRAMSELARVLTAGGLVYIQVPRKRGVPTEEDLDATTEELLAKFGQADHVRLYGDDLEQRLSRAGLVVTTRLVGETLPSWLVELIGGKPDEEIWLAGVTSDPGALLEATAVVRDLLIGGNLEGGSLLRSIRSELERARSEADQWRDAYLGLRNRLPVRVMARVRAVFKPGR